MSGVTHIVILLLVSLLSRGAAAQQAPAAPAKPAPDEPVRGAQLAHVYCQTCHLFPEPALLDKETWLNGALRSMAPLLGAARINLENRPDGKILKEAGIFPAAPIISEEDWRTIAKYYYESAPPAPLPQSSQQRIGPPLRIFKPHAMRYSGATHLTSLVRIDPRKSRVFIGNAGKRSLDTVSLTGELISRIELDSAPVDLAVRPEGMYLTLIGNLFPSDERNGKLVLATQTDGTTRIRTLLDQLARPTSAVFADLNDDGREDVILSCFGNYLGKFCWYEQKLPGVFSEHLLLEQPGAVNSVLSFTGKTKKPEIYVLMAQAREGIHRFRLNTNGIFDHDIIAEFHPAFGSSHLELADFNNDGLPDLLVTNGDNGDYPSRLKSYHGIHIFLNEGNGRFREEWSYALNGAFKAVAADFDNDGDLDLAAISFFPDYQKSPQESFVYFENKGNLDFTPHSIPESTAGRWLTMDAGDIDGDGDLDIVLGSFAEGPLSVPIPSALQQQWRTNGFSVLCLENRSTTQNGR